jgi:short-subunit dehydrogenase
MRFAGKVVLITGASSGIGRALALELARQGTRVGVTARREDRLRLLADEVRATGGTIEYSVADAADREGMRVALGSLADRLGSCDVLIANAGVGSSNSATDLNIKGAEAVIRTNLLGPMYAFEAVLPGMLARGSGHLVGVSSVASLKGLPTAAAYCASKAGLSAYLESLRITLRSRGIAVTAIQPGFVRTEMTEKNQHMMFVMDAEPAARLIAWAIWRKKKVFSFPKRMRALLWLAKWAPDRLIERMIKEGVGGREGEVRPGRDSPN